MPDNKIAETPSTVDEDKKNDEFYCDVCDCSVKDSLNWLDHINGRRHLRNLGGSYKNFEDSTLEEVKEMIAKKKRERDDKKDELAGRLLVPRPEDEDPEDDEHVEPEDEELDDEYYRKLKRDKKKRQKARRAIRDGGGNPDMFGI